MVYDEWRLPDGERQTANGEPLHSYHPVIASILARRGIDTPDAYRRFVAPSIDDLHDPAGIHGMSEACDRIERAVRDRQTILIYGDYDVDGVTSIVLLQTVLRTLGADAAHVVPHRLVDGYGLKLEVLERVLLERDVKLVITVDCGITSVEPVQRALERGIDVIVTDHHLPPGTLPAAAAVLNPKQPGCDYPFKELAGVGVAFKLCCELIRRSNKKIAIESLLKIAAIGTVADVAPLIGENRTIAWLGLNGLADPRNRGLRALIRRLGILGRPLRASDVGFRIGPRINAAGRLASADTAIDLFAAADDDAAWQLCAELDRMNAERQAVELRVREEAEKQVVSGARVFVLAGEGWHRGVIGLVAGRLAQKYHRPALVISTEGDHAGGSARSIPTINLHAQLESVAGLFTHFGGHEFACGFAMQSANVPELRRRLTEAFDGIEDDAFRRVANADGVLRFAEVGEELMNAHEMLQPFGAANPQPLFVTRGVRVLQRHEFAEDCIEIRLTDETTEATAVLWPSARAIRDVVGNGHAVDLLYQLEPSRGGARLSIVDARNSAAG